MRICGLQKTTLLDYPSLVACTVFTGGCNMRCIYCHNAPLVLSPGSVPAVDEELFFDFLKKRRGVLQGVCISGGEPTLQGDIREFAAAVKSLGYRVKLDTNGLESGVLKSLISSKVLDMIAMDIKSCPEDYPRVCGIDDALIPEVIKSARLIMESGLDYEFRTTVPGGVFDGECFEKIGRWIEGSRAYYLQPFKDSGHCMTSGLREPSEEELFAYRDIMLGYVKNTGIRG
jgi:pyruvate formate lyase activating enzyme